MTTTRRTQAQRRAATRGALLDAVLACLVERGYAGTTTTEICRRAGVSQGALFRHWDTKGELLVAAVEELFGRLFATIRDRMADVTAADDRVDAAVRALWELFQRPDLLAALELYVAARTDTDLREALVRLEWDHEQRTRDLAEELLLPPGAGEREPFRIGVSVVVDAVQGAAVRAVALEDHAEIEAELTMLVELARGLVAASTVEAA